MKVLDAPVSTFAYVILLLTKLLDNKLLVNKRVNITFKLFFILV